MHLVWALTEVPEGVRPTFADEKLPQPPVLVTAGVAVPLTLAAVVVLARAGLLLRRLPAWAPRVGCWGLGLIMVFRAVALSPIARICSGVGPMKTMSDAVQISLNSAFSARNP